MPQEYKTAITLYFANKSAASPNNYQLTSTVIVLVLLLCAVLAITKR